MTWKDYLLLIGVYFFGWFIGFLSTRSALKTKYEMFTDLKSEGILKLVYDVDDPNHPAMGLEISSLSYILTHDSILLEIKKVGFPESKGPIYLESKKDKSA